MGEKYLFLKENVVLGREFGFFLGRFLVVVSKFRVYVAFIKLV